MMQVFLALTFVIALLPTLLAQSGGTHPVSGRRYALPMGVAGAPWLDRSEREQEERVSRAIEMLRVTPGMVVADVGAGSGYYTLPLARLVGASGKVYAADIQQGMLDIIARKIKQEGVSNVSLILSAPADPKLPPASLDLAVMVDVYHELGDPQTVLAHLRRALKPEGRLVLIEYKGEDPTIPIQPLHKMTVAQAKLEVEHEGFRLVDVNSSLPWQHVLTFTALPQR